MSDPISIPWDTFAVIAVFAIVVICVVRYLIVTYYREKLKFFNKFGKEGDEDGNQKE